MKTRATSGPCALPESLRGRSERGIALILTLAILVMVTLLVVAFAISMRVENTASKNFNDLIKARQIAQAAVDQAVATIRNATPVPTNTLLGTTTYITAPGAIYTLPGVAPAPGAWVVNSLFTTNWNVASSGTVDLNQNNAITGIGVDYPKNGSPLWVGWSNITASGSSQVIGRFAYWVDDESAKVNLNVAGSRGNDLQGYTPAAIDLQSLRFQPTDQINITNYVATVRPLDTIESIKMTAPPLIGIAPNITPATYSNNQFYVTVNSASPDLTLWGDKRLNLAEVVTNNLLYPTTALKITAITNMLANANLTPWFGQTFAAKYNVVQIAANIIDYIDTDPQPTDSGSAGDTTPPAYLGLEQTPYLNELAILNQITATPFDSVTGSATLTFTTTARVELWHMYNNTWNSAGSKVNLLNTPTISVAVSPGTASPSTIGFTNSIIIGTAGATHNLSPINPYDKVTGTFGLPVQVTLNGGVIAGSVVTITLNPSLVTGIYLNGGGRIDYAVIPLTNYTTTITIGAAAQVVSNAWVTACNDPRVKPVSNNWFPQGGGATPGATTLGAANTGVTNTAVVTGSVPGDGDLSCHTNAIPRDRGTMYPGELSYIHTGLPWRTFWLEPTIAPEANAAIIPDWAALDLFSGTLATNVIGRMNINSVINNSSNSTERTLPLTALLTNNLFLTVPGYIQTTAATNAYFYSYTNAPGPGYVNLPPANFSPVYTMIGEVANTKGLGLQNAITPGTKSDRETVVRGIANIITTRSDTFTVWALAQSIKVVPPAHTGFDPANGDLITGEVKVQAIVQRSVDYSVFPAQVSFRTLYYRYIYQ